MQTGIIVYEDNDQLRASLCNLIDFTPDLLLLGNYATATGVIQQVGEAQPEIILMDIDMPGISGIEAVRLIRSVNQHVQIIMLTVFNDNQHVLDAIRAGASGYLLKKNIAEQLPDAIAQVLQGEAPMSRGIARIVIKGLQENSQPVAPDYGLTRREKEILTNLSKGHSYKMIAAALDISIDTVRTHIKKIYEKLQVHSQSEAVSKSMNERIV